MTKKVSDIHVPCASVATGQPGRSLTLNSVRGYVWCVREVKKEIPTKMVAALKQLTVFLAGGIEVAAAMLVGFAAIQATLRACPLFIPRRTLLGDEVETIRLSLGRWLTLAIEFELAADILRTAVTPTWNDIGQLAAIIVLRTVLNYFLQREVSKAESRRQLQPQQT